MRRAKYLENGYGFRDVYFRLFFDIVAAIPGLLECPLGQGRPANSDFT
jgi:hypothetical protein